MDEFDRLGREDFLKKHGFKSANQYFVKRDGRLYDSKAIYGVAHQIQFPEQGLKRSPDFSGGERQVQGPLEALGFEFEVTPGAEGVTHELPDELSISSEDVRLIVSSRAKNRYAELSVEERSAYKKVSSALERLGNLVKSKLAVPDKFEVRTTSGFNVNSGVRSYIPKDLWFSVSPKENKKDLAAIPQMFMIVSERGIEYGFGASVSPADFSQQGAKEAVKAAAPMIFDRLSEPGSSEATGISQELDKHPQWFFRTKHRLDPNVQEFSNLHEWLTYLKSSSGKTKAAGAISRYLKGDEIDNVDLSDEVALMARIFEPLLDRDWHADAVIDNRLEPNLQDMPSKDNFDLKGSNDFSVRLLEFLECYGKKRSEPFGVDEELGASMRNLQGWLEQVPAVAGRPTIKVKISVGQGGWTKTPWIALLDTRETTSTQRGRYIVFLASENLSTTYLTLNQGMTELVNRLGQREAVKEMHRVAEISRSQLQELSSLGFSLSKDIDLKSDTSAAKNYEEGTIAFVELPSERLPNDHTINAYLETVLRGYERLIIPDVAPPEYDPVEHVMAEPYSIDDALEELFLEREEVERYLATWRDKKNLILTGAPGVGKSFIARHLAYALIGFKDDSKVQTVQFHQSYSYEDFVQGYRPNGNQGFERQNGTFYEFRNKALKDPAGTYVFIIDEINRGNLSKIFGELMLLIEQDKRGPTWKTRLAYATEHDEEFYVPDNIVILGMMNTADRSLSLVDYALRRRFAFVAMKPLYGAPKFRAHLEKHGIPEDVINRIVNGMSELNQAIETDRTNLGPGFRIGHSFFTPTSAVTDPEAWYRRIVETEIHPLLEEYWFDAPETADQWRDQFLR
ncbi:MrcB family domain-containing protein [Roseovarius sp.]|uniref:MrcB family domain-containing protein n=1 Tax=Roseovarius sp. TaxID=1486281 RepID=UPI003D0A7C4E